MIDTTEWTMRSTHRGFNMHVNRDGATWAPWLLLGRRKTHAVVSGNPDRSNPALKGSDDEIRANPALFDVSAYILPL
jgi:hypothetical protein